MLRDDGIGLEDLETARPKFANVLYKVEKPSVCLHFFGVTLITWSSRHGPIQRLGLCDSYDLWHKQVCFYKFLRPICWVQECLKDSAVAPFCLA